MESKGRLLPVGAWRHIQNFTLTPSTGMYRSTDHPFKMSIIQSTSITKSTLNNEDMYLSLVDFQTVLGGSLKTCFLIDVIGQVQDLGDLESIQVSGKPRMKLEFTLRDINDARVPCCLWGKFAEILYEGCRKDEEGKPICLIRFAKIGRFRGELQITNAFEASLVLINPDIAETAAFKQMFVDEVKPLALCEGRDETLDLEEVKCIQEKRDKWMLYPKRTIHELLQSTQNSVNLLDNEGDSEGMATPSTTPSTKRKGEWSDPPPDITSTSKNLRLKTIKVEKMSDLEKMSGKKT
ncbi:hypothetical protein Rs2_16300 [Raphanus sativus]|nr:hypothetical protein Rs2_16300 [Raphanus sativus]